MPDTTNYTPIQLAWSTFAASVHALLAPQPDDRPLDQFLEFRDRVMVLVRSEAFLNELAQGIVETEPDDGVEEALLAELSAFSRAAEVARLAEEAEERKTWVSRLLPRAGTAVGSVKDLLSNLPPLAKSGLTLLKELIDMFKK